MCAQMHNYDIGYLINLNNHFNYFNPLAVEFIYLVPFTECIGSINRPTAVKGLDWNQDEVNETIKKNVLLFLFNG